MLLEEMESRRRRRPRGATPSSRGRRGSCPWSSSAAACRDCSRPSGFRQAGLPLRGGREERRASAAPGGRTAIRAPASTSATTSTATASSPATTGPSSSPSSPSCRPTSSGSWRSTTSSSTCAGAPRSLGATWDEGTQAWRVALDDGGDPARPARSSAPSASSTGHTCPTSPDSFDGPSVPHRPLGPRRRPHRQARRHGRRRCHRLPGRARPSPTRSRSLTVIQRTAQWMFPNPQLPRVASARA